MRHDLLIRVFVVALGFPGISSTRGPGFWG